jgi:hypothetical protein
MARDNEGGGKLRCGDIGDGATRGRQGNRLAGNRQCDKAARGRGDNMAVGMGDKEDGGELGSRQGDGGGGGVRQM